MSLAFPATPSVGQVYQNWRWTGSSWDQNPGNIVNTFNTRSGVVTLQASDLSAVGAALKVGNRNLIGSQKVLGTSAVQIFDTPNNFADWDIIEVEWYGLRANADISCQLQVAHGAGLVWETGGGYYTAYKAHTSGNVDGSWGGTGVGIWMGGVSAGGVSHCGVARLFGAPVSNRPKHVQFRVSTNTGSAITYFSGYGQDWNANNNQPVTALRFIASSNAFTDGVFNWYGIGNGPNRL